MLKRWTALPREARWLAAGIVAVVLGLAVIWVLFVPVADWLAHHDVGSATGSLHETAVDNARGRLLALGAGLFAAAALVFTARNFTLSREGQVTRARILLKANQGEAGTGWSDRAAYAALPRPYRRAHHDPSATD